MRDPRASKEHTCINHFATTLQQRSNNALSSNALLLHCSCLVLALFLPFFPAFFLPCYCLVPALLQPGHRMLTECFMHVCLLLAHESLKDQAAAAASASSLQPAAAAAAALQRTVAAAPAAAPAWSLRGQRSSKQQTCMKHSVPTRQPRSKQPLRNNACTRKEKGKNRARTGQEKGKNRAGTRQEQCFDNAFNVSVALWC